MSLVVHVGAVFGLFFVMTIPGGQDKAETVITVDFVAATPEPEPEPVPEPVPETAKPAEVSPPPEPPTRQVPLPSSESNSQPETPVLEKVEPSPQPVQPPPIPEKPVQSPKPKKTVKATPRKRADVKPATPSPDLPAAVATAPGPPASAPSVAVPPAAPTPLVSPGLTQDDLLRDYGNRVWARVVRHKPSGMIARGATVVRFSISAEGSLIAATIVKSSGIDALDRASLAAVSAASPFPSPPVGATQEQLTFTIPFDYH